MNLLESFVTAVALSLDALAVAVAAGLASGRAKPRDVLRVAACFGGFQAGMPLLGAGLGAGVAPMIESAAPYVAGAVLVGLGLYAIRNAMRGDDDEEQLAFLDTRVLLGLGVATSIDAFAIGVTFSLRSVPIAPNVAIIGVVTFVLSGLGMQLADRVEQWLGERTEIAGGVALVLVGAHILVDAITSAP